MEQRKGYIYKVTNKVNGKIYIGQCWRKRNDYENYYGSGVLIKRAIKKYGIENFTKETLVELVCNKPLIDELERHYINLYASWVSTRGYNIEKGNPTFGIKYKGNPKFKKYIYVYESPNWLLFEGGYPVSKTYGMASNTLSYHLKRGGGWCNGVYISPTRLDVVPKYQTPHQKRVSKIAIPVYMYDGTNWVKFESCIALEKQLNAFGGVAYPLFKKQREWAYVKNVLVAKKILSEIPKKQHPNKKLFYLFDKNTKELIKSFYKDDDIWELLGIKSSTFHYRLQGNNWGICGDYIISKTNVLQ